MILISEEENMDWQTAESVVGEIVFIDTPSLAPGTYGVLVEFKGNTCILWMMCQCGKHKWRNEVSTNMLVSQNEAARKFSFHSSEIKSVSEILALPEAREGG